MHSSLTLLSHHSRQVAGPVSDSPRQRAGFRVQLQPIRVLAARSLQDLRPAASVSSHTRLSSTQRKAPSQPDTMHSRARLALGAPCQPLSRVSVPGSHADAALASHIDSSNTPKHTRTHARARAPFCWITWEPPNPLSSPLALLGGWHCSQSIFLWIFG